jgi:putative ubiquitin-RnfH superfamily antitoxin RatB of RatAB toxin-antitoxin module
MAGMRVEVVYALAETADAVSVTLPSGATAADAVIASGMLERHPEIDLLRHKLGIYGKAVESGARVADGDRVEIYRPLMLDPKEARRRRARKKT